MAQPAFNSISYFVNQLTTNEAFATEIQELVANLLHGTATVDDLRRRVAIDPVELRAMAPPEGGYTYSTDKTTGITITTVKCLSALPPPTDTPPLPTPPPTTTLTITPILAVDADGSVE